MSFNVFDYEDPAFPTLMVGKDSEDGVMESAEDKSAGIQQMADIQLRSMAMGAVLTWVDEADFGFEPLAAMVSGVADLDEDDNLTAEEKAVYEDMWPHVSDALISLGGDEENVSDFLNDEDDEAGALLGKRIADTLSEETATDDEIVAGFASEQGTIFENADGEEMVLEAAYKKVKVVRNGKVKIVKKRIGGHYKMSPKQRAALKKARRKSGSSAARIARKKAMKVRKQRGL